MLHSFVNLWGFAVYQDGRRIRGRAGSADDGVFCDDGAPLPEEAELLAHSRIEGGERLYRLPSFPDEDFAEDQVGEEYVFKIYRRFTGLQLNMDEALLDMKCAGFRLGAPRKQWWKF